MSVAPASVADTPTTSTSDAYDLPVQIARYSSGDVAFLVVYQPYTNDVPRPHHTPAVTEEIARAWCRDTLGGADWLVVCDSSGHHVNTWTRGGSHVATDGLGFACLAHHMRRTGHPLVGRALEWFERDGVHHSRETTVPWTLRDSGDAHAVEVVDADDDRHAQTRVTFERPTFGALLTGEQRSAVDALASTPSRWLTLKVDGCNHLVVWRGDELNEPFDNPPDLRRATQRTHHVHLVSRSTRASVHEADVVSGAPVDGARRASGSGAVAVAWALRQWALTTPERPLVLFTDTGHATVDWCDDKLVLMVDTRHDDDTTIKLPADSMSHVTEHLRLCGSETHQASVYEASRTARLAQPLMSETHAARQTECYCSLAEVVAAPSTASEAWACVDVDDVIRRTLDGRDCYEFWCERNDSNRGNAYRYGYVGERGGRNRLSKLKVEDWLRCDLVTAAWNELPKHLRCAAGYYPLTAPAAWVRRAVTLLEARATPAAA